VNPDGSTGTGIVTKQWNGHAWRTVIAPVPPGTIGAGLLGVSVISTRDAWAVGYAQVLDATGASTFHTVIDHWDGNRWKPLQESALPTGVVLNAVAATGPDSL
jgi:hypothetical protein